MENMKLQSTHNTRDISFLVTKDGHKIKKNKLIRSGSLIKLTDDDVKMLQDINLKVVIDFRSTEEFVTRADRRIENVTYINLPALPKDDLKPSQKYNHVDSNLIRLVDKENGGKQVLLKSYKNLFITEEGLFAYKEFFNILENNEDGAILWHCSQGKDRAGMAAFLLEYALGVSLEDCIEDYMFTNVAMELKIKELTKVVLKLSDNDYELLPQLKDVFSADMDYLNTALNTIKGHYETLDNFIVNVLKVNIDLLKEKYLEK